MLCPFARRVLIAFLYFAPAPVASQVVARDASPVSFLLIGGAFEDRVRIAQVLGKAPTAGWLLRSASVLADTVPRSWHQLRFAVVQPYADLTWNSALPFSLNDGVQWAGRGLTGSVSAGFAARIGRMHVNLVPQIWRAENAPIPVLPPGDTGRKGFSSPWNVGVISADIPLRLGYHSTTAIDFGESAAWITGYGMAGGVSNENQWWGPGIRNALLMSNNAGGIPHAFLRTAAPVRTRVGDFEGRWIVGGLSESRFFDVHLNNNLRSLSGVVITYRPVFEPDLTAGLSRVVYANGHSVRALPARAFDAFFRWGEGGNVKASTFGHAAEQLTSLFGRWVFPASGAEVYGEWARIILPLSLRSLFIAPQYSQGYTAGLQWVTPRENRPLYRVQFEVTNLEQSPITKQADTISFYTSRAVPQGYTQRGQVIGASIGPGSSSQWLAVDRLARGYDLGLFVGRIRWNTDAYYTQSTSIYYNSYDATLFGGARGGVRAYGRELAVEYAVQRRYNYLFQNELDGWSQNPTFDKTNVTLRVRLY